MNVFARVLVLCVALTLAWAASTSRAERRDTTASRDGSQTPPPRSGTAASLSGEAIAVKDGDSIVVLAADGRTLQIRVAGIDAPEKGQPWGDVSRRHLAGLLRGRELRIEALKIDRYGRTVANVYVEEIDVGLAQVSAGLAWHFKRYQSDQTAAQRIAYATAEVRARESHAGLWRDPQPLEPWKHREMQRKAARHSAADATVDRAPIQSADADTARRGAAAGRRVWRTVS